VADLAPNARIAKIVGQILAFLFGRFVPNLYPIYFGASVAFIARSAFSCISGNTWEYISIVIAGLAWPRRSDTTFGLTPFSIRIVARVCRRPWIVSLGSPAIVTIFLNYLFARPRPG